MGEEGVLSLSSFEGFSSEAPLLLDPNPLLGHMEWVGWCQPGLSQVLTMRCDFRQSFSALV